MGWLLGDHTKLEGPFPGPFKSSNSVFAGSAESVSFLAAITRLRSADTDSLQGLSTDCRPVPQLESTPHWQPPPRGTVTQWLWRVLSLIVARIVTYSDNLQLIINASGTVIENNRTLPYGEAWLTESTPSTNDKKFTTYQRDAESNLDYARNRYYALTAGRFASIDKDRPILPLPSTLNRYTYVVSDPLNHMDSSGLRMTLTIEGPILSMLSIGVGATIFGPEGERGPSLFIGSGSGGAEPGGGGGDDGRGYFRDYAKELLQDQSKTDCERMALLVTKAGELNTRSNGVTNTIGMVTMLLQQLTELTSLTNSNAPASDPNYRVTGFGATGFKPQFRDPGNQVRHATGYLAAGFYFGLVPTAAIAVWRERNEPTSADRDLGIAAAGIGDMLRETGDFRAGAAAVSNDLCDKPGGR